MGTNGLTLGDDDDDCLCFIRPKGRPGSIVLTNVLCTMQDQSLIDDEMISNLCSTWIKILSSIKNYLYIVDKTHVKIT